MTDLELTRQNHIESFKALIDAFRAKANVFVSVMEVRLNFLLDESKISTRYRHDILEYLKNNGFLIIQGERKLMRYKFIEPLIKTDSLTMATRAYEALSIVKPLPKKLRFKHQPIKDEVIKTEPFVMTVARDYTLKDKVVFLRNNLILQGEIVSSQFGYKEVTNPDEGPKLIIDFDVTIYDVMITSYIPERGTIIKDLDKSELYSSIDVLLHALNAKFQHSLRILKAK